jgi:superfamily I DNA/RNA helicase
MPALVRSLVWDLYEEYRAVCDTEEAPVVDWNRFLQVALQVVRETPALDHERYDAIVVDEAQDITEVGVRLLVELLEGGSSGRILMVGDSGQRIYPGGYRLADLGLEIRGRSFPMTVCYRSTDEIMQAAGALGQFLSTEEFGEDGLRELSMSTVRSGPRPRLLRFPSEAEEAGWVLAQLDPDDPDVDATAVLVPSNRAVGEWRARLEEGGLGSVPLDEYHGRPLPGVKVGTYNRAKGLEFKRVFLPNLGAWYPNCDRNDPDEMIERGSVLYVAMSRARDELTLTYVGVPSMFLRPVARFCELEPTSGRP